MPQRSHNAERRAWCKTCLRISRIAGAYGGRQVAHCAAPGVMARLVEIADGLHGAGVREQIAAGRLVLEVAGAMEADAGGRENAPLSQETVSALRRVMASGEERLVLLEEAIREREAATIEGEAGTLPE